MTDIEAGQLGLHQTTLARPLWAMADADPTAAGPPARRHRSARVRTRTLVHPRARSIKPAARSAATGSRPRTAQTYDLVYVEGWSCPWEADTGFRQRGPTDRPYCRKRVAMSLDGDLAKSRIAPAGPLAPAQPTRRSTTARR